MTEFAAPTSHLIRYRTLTHTNVGWCAATVLRSRLPGGVSRVVVRDVDGHLGPKVRPAARMVAAVVHSELIEPNEPWILWLVEYDGSLTEVGFEQAFAGWFGRPSYRAVTEREIAETSAALRFVR